MHRRLLVLAPLTAAAALVLAGCSGTASGAGTGDGRISIVASTDVYGQIAQVVGGDAVDVTSLIDSPTQDPHEYEASASDQLAVKSAGLLIENGGGYDPFFDALLQASGSSAPVIVAAEYSPAWPTPATADGTASTLGSDPHAQSDHADGQPEDFNEHVWYDPATAGRVANAIAAELSALDPAHATDFAANAATFGTGIQKLEDSLSAIAAAHAGAPVFITEPVPGYLLDAAKLENVTPDAFSEAVEAGTDVPPATLVEALGLIKGGGVKLVITNAQAAGAETTQVIDAANSAGVPTFAVMETLPDGLTYLQWMQNNIDELAQALGK
jgi:zinc/manganese transport system substrate-binding protein